MSQPILLTGDAGGGTSLIARAFMVSGMFVGNKNTCFDRSFKYHVENSILGRSWARIKGVPLTELSAPGVVQDWERWIAPKSTEELWESIGWILDAYREEAERKYEDFYGLKLTVETESDDWHRLWGMFREKWPGMIAVGILRHPLFIMERSGLSGGKEHSAVHDWLRRAKWKIASCDYILWHPHCWIDRSLHSLLKTLGLWPTEWIDELFRSDKLRISCPGRFVDFHRDFPEVRELTETYGVCMTG